ncbi:hypothetical protein [Pseudoduganella buxea]|uniref:Uncharacterized protein n=1 Tax=Pseudoduganella buxea TaxID=1949069 RepID=A0A6I3SV11_9BURK|nr:hypothetical protein [Pseudoduganella buxea]MTV53031.1 hypothetical protein [Pseudoduganella buxea]GGC08015.1 hypothetical protein GCM10011572_32030 [Pseudoduganella buxea]
MTDYDNEYYFIRMDDNRESLPYLRPDTNTNERRFRNKAPAMGSSPLIFTNALKDDFRKAGAKAEIADILFESSNFVVRDHIRAKILEHEIPGMFLHPAVYIDDEDEWHEDYWFVGFSSRFDCWDRENSTYSSPPLQIGANEFYDMYTYSLNSKLLDATPLEDRLMFQMGGTQDAMIVCHKSLARVFRGGGQSGALLQLVSDY